MNKGEATPEEIAQYKQKWREEVPRIPYGYCQCGCGEKTTPAVQTLRKAGRYNGEPVKWIVGHNAAKAKILSSEEYRQEWREKAPDIPYGYCWCGCGQITSISGQGHGARKVVKGEPERYLIGHRNRAPRKISVEDRGYLSSCHIWEGGKSGNKNGTHIYGVISVGARSMKAHRVIFEECKGPIPNGYEIHHLCEQTLCVNPEHLQPLSKSDHLKTFVAKFSDRGHAARGRTNKGL